MEPIRVNGRDYMRMDGNWYDLEKGIDHPVTSEIFIQGLEAIYTVHSQLEPFLNGISHDKD